MKPITPNEKEQIESIYASICQKIDTTEKAVKVGNLGLVILSLAVPPTLHYVGPEVSQASANLLQAMDEYARALSGKTESEHIMQDYLDPKNGLSAFTYADMVVSMMTNEEETE